MSDQDTIPDLARPAFFSGQRLEANDFAAIFDFQRGLRWLHNRTLHTWGVATGFDVSGKKGGKEVTVKPGYALDCNGRDVLLSRPITLQVPPVAGAPAGGAALYYLTASYLADDDIAPTESRA